MAVSLARRNLFEGKTRFVMSVGGVALAILLILVLDGVFAGALARVALFIENTPFQIAIAQDGVTNMHMTSSFFPVTKVNEVKRVKGVKEVNTILLTSDFLVSGENRSVAYIVGYHPGRPGGPWAMAEGTSDIKSGEIIIDEQIARKYNLKIGDSITALGRSFKIGGLASDTVNIVNSVAFMRFDDFERARGMRSVVSYAFVTVEPGENPGTVLSRIENQVKDITVMTKSQFIENERRVIDDMSVDIIRAMNFVGFLIGLTVLGLTAYTTTLSKIREYGVLKAIGSRNTQLMGIVVQQALISVVVGLVLAVALNYALAGGLSLAGSNIALVMTFESIVKIILGAVVVTALASLVPILRIAGLNPADVFRR